MDKMYEIAIIGGGPGGVGAAVESVMLGFEKIILIEKGDNHSQTIRKYYKDNKRVDKDWKGQTVELLGKVEFVDGTKESTIDFFDKLIDSHKIDSFFNTEVEKIIHNGHFFEISTSKGKMQAKYVIVAIGKMGKPNKPDYELPASLKNLINFNLDNCSEHEKILVVGGGNSAVEYAYELAILNDVTLSYRQKEFGRVNPENVDIIRKYENEGKLKIWLESSIAEIENQKGKPLVKFANGDEVVFDRIIFAIGGTTPKGFLHNCGVEVDEAGEPMYDENFETSQKGLFVAGDIAVKNGGSIAIALNHAFKILTFINQTKENK